MMEGMNRGGRKERVLELADFYSGSLSHTQFYGNGSTGRFPGSKRALGGVTTADAHVVVRFRECVLVLMLSLSTVFILWS